MKQHPQFYTVARALQYLADHQQEQPGLDELAEALKLSPFHLQKTFQSWAGVTPKQFLQFLTRNHALAQLRSGASVLNAALDAGLSGPGRLHDLTLQLDAITPGEARRGGAGVTLRQGEALTPFGPALMAWSDRGLSFLAFTHELGRRQALSQLQGQWPNAHLIEDEPGAREWAGRIFSNQQGQALTLWLRGSPFQLAVWRALLEIPDATCVSYGDLARAIEKPGAGRAVGTAVGRNPVAWLIPCHRVIRSIGETGDYRWGAITKKALLGYEAARHSTPDFQQNAGATIA